MCEPIILEHAVAGIGFGLGERRPILESDAVAEEQSGYGVGSAMSTGVESETEVADERRREPRVDVDFSVRFQAPLRAEGRAMELSSSGLRVEVGDDLSHAVQVSVEFDLPEADAPIGALADVRWHKQLGPKSDPSWVCGLRFDDLTRDQQAAIWGHIEAVRARRHA
jgi:hypothetical protein